MEKAGLEPQFPLHRSLGGKNRFDLVQQMLLSYAGVSEARAVGVDPALKPVMVFLCPLLEADRERV